MASNELDKIARDLIEKAGYGSYFSHSLGHGLGLQIHEWPGVSYRCQYRLPERAAVTIEPGIYIPDQLGVRIEDIVILLPEGCEVITQSPKNLIVL
jgi:Xaa-Pro aminopeptidase